MFVMNPHLEHVLYVIMMIVVILAVLLTVFAPDHLRWRPFGSRLSFFGMFLCGIAADKLYEEGAFSLASILFGVFYVYLMIRECRHDSSDHD